MLKLPRAIALFLTVVSFVSTSDGIRTISGLMVIVYIILEGEYGRYRKANPSPLGGAANGAGAAAPGRTGGSAAASSRADPLSRTGLETGEIIAWRFWFCFHGELLLLGIARNSDGQHAVWAPGEPMTGEPGDYDKVGVHAWKTKRAALEYMQIFGNGGVVGRVALWGEVVEHEKGYRAQYGKVISIDYVDLWSIKQDGKRKKNDESHKLDARDLERLRQVYGVEVYALTPLKDD